jgi:hypothetical protein
MKQPWEETQATVLHSRYQFARLNTLTLGVQIQKKFRVTFEYIVDGERYTGAFQSDKALLQDSRIPLRYNPLNPEENNYALQPPVPELSLITIGIAGSIVLSLLWFFLLHHTHR